MSKHFILRRVSDGAETIVAGDLIVGRTPGCGLMLPPDTGASAEPPRQNARLVMSRGVLWVEDLGSKNGTFVNGSRVAAGTMLALKRGDRLRIDLIEFAVHESALDPGDRPAALSRPLEVPGRPTPPVKPAPAPGAVASASPSAVKPAVKAQPDPKQKDQKPKDPPRDPKEGTVTPSATPATPPARPPPPPLELPRMEIEENLSPPGRVITREGGSVAPAAPLEVPDVRGPMLRVLTGALAGKHFTLESAPGESVSWRIGRHANQDIILPHVSVSAEHARIVNQSGRWEIIDQLSRTGTFVNGRHVMRSPLATGDRLLIGAIQCTFEFPGQTLQFAKRKSRFIDVPALIISMAVTSTVVVLIWRYLPELQAALHHLWGRT